MGQGGGTGDLELGQHHGRDMAQGPAAGGGEVVFEAASENPHHHHTLTEKSLRSLGLGRGSAAGRSEPRALRRRDAGRLRGAGLRQARAHCQAAGQASCPRRDREHKATQARTVPSPAGPVPQDLNMVDRAGCWQQGLSTVSGMTSDELGPRAIGEPSQEEQEMGPEA